MSLSTSPESSITRCLDRLKQGDRAAAERLWGAYIRRLVGLARAKMRAAPRRAADEEDVALSAFDSFCRRAERGQFARLSDRDDLWQGLGGVPHGQPIGPVRRGGGEERRGGGGVWPPRGAGGRGGGRPRPRPPPEV